MKVCFIGLGSIGTRHCLNLYTLCRQKGISLEVHAVRSSDRPLKETLSGIGIRTLRSYEEMDPNYDMIFVTNPTSMHYETLMKTGDKSHLFFIEKPVFDREDDNQEALPLSEGTVCYVAAPLRYTSVITAAREFVKTHDIYCARAISSSYLPDWRPGQDYRLTYSAHKDLGGGVAIDLIHEWDYLTMLFGMPESVQSMSGRYSDLEIDSEDLAVYIARYPTFLAEVHLDYFGRETQRELELYTKEGCTHFDIAHSRVVFPNGEIRQYKEEPNDKYLREMEYFMSLMEDGKKDSENSIRHACNVLRITKGAATE